MSTLDSQPAKHIYLANRHPRPTREGFAERWRRHSRIGESLADTRLQSSVSSLRYCLTINPSGMLESANDEHDGVALLALRSILSIPTVHALLVQNEVAFADELRTFERPVEDIGTYTASEAIVDGAETDYVVVDLARRRPDLGPVEYFRQADLHSRAACQRLVDVGVRRWIRNVTIAPAARGFAYDCVDEYWFDSPEVIRTAAPVLEEFFDEARQHAERRASITLVTNVILKIGRDRP
jgi:hypothetical protein